MRFLNYIMYFFSKFVIDFFGDSVLSDSTTNREIEKLQPKGDAVYAIIHIILT